MTVKNTIIQDILSKLKNEIEKSPNKKINIAISDTETTGLVDVEMTQFAMVVKSVSLSEDGQTFVFEDVAESSNYYYPGKQVDPYAAYVTNIVRREDMQDKKYVKTLKDVWKEKKKPFDEKNLIMLDKSLPEYKKENFEDLIEKYDVKMIAGHNYYGYDYLTVLKETYKIDIPTLEIFDTMLFPLHTKDAKSLRGKTLDKEIAKVVTKEQKEYYESLEAKRLEAHDALIDVKLNVILFEAQMQKSLAALNQRDENQKEEVISQNPDNRAYAEGDVLYISTQISGDNILKFEDALDYAANNGIKRIVVVDNMLSNVIRYQEKLSKMKKENPELDIQLNFGYKFEDKNSDASHDVIFKNTMEYRKALPILFSKESGISYNERVNDIKATTENIILPSEKIEKPKMLQETEKHNYFFFKRYKEKGIFTPQESTNFLEQATVNKSLNGGVYTSDVKQNWLRDNLSDFQDVDFAFYNDLNLSAFPALPLLYDGIDKEPEDMEGYITVLRKFIKEKAEANNMKFKIARLNEDRARRNPPLPPITEEMYEKRIEDEIEILRQMGDTDYIKYFFLVSDWESKMEFGPGRGSVGGSLIAYEIGVTDTDPLEFGLLFERFLDPSRPDYPDIDFDIMDKHYTEAILKEENNRKVKDSQDYNNALYSIYSEEIKEKYVKGEHNFIGKIKTFSVATRKVLLNNFIRMSMFPHAIQKAIRDEYDEEVSIMENVMANTKRDEILKNYDIQFFVNLEKLVDLYTNFGVHAAGILAYPHHSHCIGPVDEDNTTHFDKKDIEKLKMIKMDALGLNTLLILNEIIAKVKEEDPRNEIFKNNIDPRNDAEVLFALQNGFTTSTFQMESGGMKRILNDLAPIEFEDLIAITALYRPGPMDSIPSYISLAQAAKREKYDIEYIDKKAWDALSDEEQSVIVEEARQKMILGGVNELQVSKDSVVANVINREPFLDSTDFEAEQKTRYTKLMNGTYEFEETPEYEILQKIVDKYKITSELEFVDKIREIENYLNEDPIYAQETRETYKTLVYQEQIMFYSISAGGYTKAESNDLRKAIGKKIAEKMAEHKIKLVNGLVGQGMEEEIASYLWNKIESFGKYAFNKSHAASYSIITYMTQYYKEKYPMIAYSTMLKHVAEKTQMALIKEIRERGMKLELQKMDENFTLDFVYDEDTIYVPLTYMKGLGPNNLYSLIDLLQTYKMNSIEEMILFSGKVDKPMLENLGTLGFFEKENEAGELYSEISQKEWYYLSSAKDLSNSDKKVLTDSILKKALEPLIKTVNNELKNEFKNTIYENEKLIRELSILNEMKTEVEKLEKASAQEDADDKAEENTIKFYKEVEKQTDKVLAELEKTKSMSEVLRAEFEERINAGDFVFFKEGDYIQKYANYVEKKSEIVSKYSSKAREAVKEQKRIVDLSKYEEDTWDFAARKLTATEEEDAYVKKQINIFDTKLDLEKKPEILDTYFQPLDMDQVSETGFARLSDVSKEINVIFLTEFMTKADVNPKQEEREYLLKKNTKVGNEWVKASQTRTMFDDVLETYEGEGEIKMGYMSFMNITEDEFNALDEEEQRELLIKSWEEKMVPLIKSGVQNIILSSKLSKDSKLRKKIETLREKKFLPKNGETHRILFDGVGKYVSFVGNMYPYKSLNTDIYEMRMNEILTVLGSVKKFSIREQSQAAEDKKEKVQTELSKFTIKADAPKNKIDFERKGQEFISADGVFIMPLTPEQQKAIMGGVKEIKDVLLTTPNRRRDNLPEWKKKIVILDFCPQEPEGEGGSGEKKKNNYNAQKR